MSLQPALIEYASPTLASLKCGSLFSLIPADMQLLKREAAQMSAILAPKGLSLRLIDVGGGRILCYMFRHVQLLTMLSGSREAAFLKELGYSSLAVSDAVDTLCARLSTGGDFPHEVGLFLGYPVEDVIGFIENKGKNCLCCGCWKCYSNACAAQKALTSSANAPTSISVFSPADAASTSLPSPRNRLYSGCRVHRGCPHHRKENIQNE